MSPAPPADALQYYERALSLTRAMLEAARRGDWDELVRLETERSRLIEQIRRDDQDSGGDRALAAHKHQIMTLLLQTDEQVQLLTQDWMQALRDASASIGRRSA